MTQKEKFTLITSLNKESVILERKINELINADEMNELEVSLSISDLSELFSTIESISKIKTVN